MDLTQVMRCGWPCSGDDLLSFSDSSPKRGTWLPGVMTGNVLLVGLGRLGSLLTSDGSGCPGGLVACLGPHSPDAALTVRPGGRWSSGWWMSIGVSLWPGFSLRAIRCCRTVRAHCGSPRMPPSVKWASAPSRKRWGAASIGHEVGLAAPTVPANQGD